MSVNVHTVLCGSILRISVVSSVMALRGTEGRCTHGLPYRMSGVLENYHIFPNGEWKISRYNTVMFFRVFRM
jgi:hypothetical protein